MDPITIKLRKPIPWGKDGALITELVFQPLTGEVLRKIKISEYFFALYLDIAAACTGQPAGVINQLSGDDLSEVVDVAKSFTPAGLGIGMSASGR